MAVPLTPEEEAALASSGAGFTPGAPPVPSASPAVSPDAFAGISPADVGAQAQRNLAAAGVTGGKFVPRDMFDEITTGGLTPQHAAEIREKATPPTPGAPIAGVDAAAAAKQAAAGPVGAAPIPLAMLAGRGGGGSGASSALAKQLAEDQAKIDASNKRVQGALGEAQGAAGAAGQAHEDVAYNAIAGVTNAQTQAAEIQAQRDKGQKEAQAKWDAFKTQREADVAKIKDVSPEHYWESQSIGDKVRMSIGVALGAIGASLSHTANFAQDMLDGAIKRDVEAQRSNIEKQWKRVAGNTELAKDDLARGQYIDDQLKQKTMMGYEMANRQAQAYALTATSADAQARAKDYIAGNEAKIQGLEQAGIQQDMARIQAKLAAGNAPSQLAVLKGDWDKYYKSQVEKGERPKDFDEYARERMTGRVAGAAGGPAGGDPLASVPKGQLPAATKEQEEHAKATATAAQVGQLYDQWDKTSVTSPRQLAALKGQIATRIKAGAGPGMSSDEDFTRFIEPNLPQWGDSKETLAVKKETIQRGLASSAPTPILDRHAPGWKGPGPIKLPPGAKVNP